MDNGDVELGFEYFFGKDQHQPKSPPASVTAADDAGAGAGDAADGADASKAAVASVAVCDTADSPAVDSEGMRWVTIVSSQTIHMSMCLSQMVDELLRLRHGRARRTPADRHGTFKPRKQRARKPLDLSFLTHGAAGANDDATAATDADADTGAAAADSAAVDVSTDGNASAASSNAVSRKSSTVAVTLSDLTARVQAQDSDSDYSD